MAPVHRGDCGAPHDGVRRGHAGRQRRAAEEREPLAGIVPDGELRGEFIHADPQLLDVARRVVVTEHLRDECLFAHEAVAVGASQRACGVRTVACEQRLDERAVHPVDQVGVIGAPFAPEVHTVDPSVHRPYDVDCTVRRAGVTEGHLTDETCSAPQPAEWVLAEHRVACDRRHDDGVLSLDQQCQQSCRQRGDVTQQLPRRRPRTEQPIVTPAPEFFVWSWTEGVGEGRVHQA